MSPQIDEMPRVDGARTAPAGAYPPAPPERARYPQPASYPVPQAQPPYGRMPPAAAQPVGRYAGYRLALAIVSLALFIPLAAIALGAATAFNATFGAWVGALIVIGAVVLGVNAAFNYWLDARRR